MEHDKRDHWLRQQYHQLLTTSPHQHNTDALRKLLLLEGLPSDANTLQTAMFGRCSLRGLVWKVLLGIGHVDVDEYTQLVKRGPSIVDSRVREDARRTFAKSDDFTTRVPTSKIIRVLNAYVMHHGNQRGIYAQSMSLLAAPFLYIMPEPDAFHCFRSFLEYKVTSYIEKYAGARSACQLLDRCIMKCLPDLHQILNKHDLYAEVYAFPVMSSLGMCVRPVYDTVRLWDIVLAFGIHMHIIFTLARLALRSDDIVKEAKLSGAAPISTRELEQGFGFDAKTVLSKGVKMSAQLDEDLYDELLCHASTASWTPTSILKSKSKTTFNELQDQNQGQHQNQDQDQHQDLFHAASSKASDSINNCTNNSSSNTTTTTNSSSNTTLNSRSFSIDRHGIAHESESNETLERTSSFEVNDKPFVPGDIQFIHQHDDDDDDDEEEDNDFDENGSLSHSTDAADTLESTGVRPRTTARRGIRTAYDRIQQQNLSHWRESRLVVIVQ